MKQNRDTSDAQVKLSNALIMSIPTGKFPSHTDTGSGTTGTGTVGVDGPTLMIEGLLADTTYDFYFFEECTDGSTDSLWTAFTTNEFAPPANDLCANAIVLECGDIDSSSTQYAHFSPSLHLQHVSSGSLGNVTFSADAINPDAHLSLLTGLQPLGVTLIASVPAAHSIIIIEDNYLNEHCSKIYFSNALVAFMSCGFSMTSDLPRVSAT